MSVNPFSPVTQRHIDSGINAPAKCLSRTFGTTDGKMTWSNVSGDEAHRMDWLHHDVHQALNLLHHYNQCINVQRRLVNFFSRQRFGPGNNGRNDVDSSINSPPLIVAIGNRL